MSEKRRVLLTNDDGYYSDGIKAIAAELRRKHDVFIVAPDREQSASSHSLTLNRPLRVHEVERDVYATDGTPTDCVMLAIHMLFKKRKPDLIISGINHGANMGDDVTYSGTVAAAIEGSILHIPSLAISMAHWEPGMSMVRAAKFSAKLIDRLGKMGLEPSTFLNVNFPPDNGKPYADYRFTQLGLRQYKDIVIQKTDPRGKHYYWIGGRPKWTASKGSDFDTVESGKVSISPLHLNFTDDPSLKKLLQLDLKL